MFFRHFFLVFMGKRKVYDLTYAEVPILEIRISFKYKPIAEYLKKYGKLFIPFIDRSRAYNAKKAFEKYIGKKVEAYRAFIKEENAIIVGYLFKIHEEKR